MRNQRIQRQKPKPPVEVVNNKQPVVRDLTIANQPVRTVHLVEVGNMSTNQMKILLGELAKSHQTATDGIHYILPVRNGKLNSDVIFEQEFLELIRQLCTVDESGAIIFKDGAKDVCVIRQRV